MDDLIKVLNCLIDEHWQISTKWQNIGNRMNFKNKTVSSIAKEMELYDTIFGYHFFLKKNYQDLLKIKSTNLQSSTLEMRIKKQNSIEDKIRIYAEKNNGKIQLLKCLNDIFGVRLILERDFSHEEILDLVSKFHPQLKCIDSSKGDYIASHIYFKHDNYSLQWELQVWSKNNEKANKMSHNRYKQQYARWETNF